MTLVYQIDGSCRRFLVVIKVRDIVSLTGFFETLGAERCTKIRVVCPTCGMPISTSSPPCLPSALNMLDQFRIAKKHNEGRR